MIKKVKAIPLSLATMIKDDVLKNTFSAYGDWDNVLMISINNSDFAAVFKPDSRTLVLHFDDTTPKATRTLSHLLADKFMDSTQAIEIVEFIHRWDGLEMGKNLLLVHCHAGVCRSGAVASFTQFMCNVNSYMFQADNPNIQPNRWVEEKLYEAYINKFPIHKKVEGIFRH